MSVGVLCFDERVCAHVNYNAEEAPAVDRGEGEGQVKEFKKGDGERSRRFGLRCSEAINPDESRQRNTQTRKAPPRVRLDRKVRRQSGQRH